MTKTSKNGELLLVCDFCNRSMVIVDSEGKPNFETMMRSKKWSILYNAGRPIATACTKRKCSAQYQEMRNIILGASRTTHGVMTTLLVMNEETAQYMEELRQTPRDEL